MIPNPRSSLWMAALDIRSYYLLGMEDQLEGAAQKLTESVTLSKRAALSLLLGSKTPEDRAQGWAQEVITHSLATIPVTATAVNKSHAEWWRNRETQLPLPTLDAAFAMADAGKVRGRYHPTPVTLANVHVPNNVPPFLWHNFAVAASWQHHQVSQFRAYQRVLCAPKCHGSVFFVAGSLGVCVSISGL